MNDAVWTILLLPTAQKELDRLDDVTRSRVVQRLLNLRDNPWGGDSRKLKGATGLYRLRIGDYRAIYRIVVSNHQVIVNHILHRSEAYQSLN